MGTTGSFDVTILRTLTESQRTGARIRIVLRSTSAGASVRTLEGFATEIVSGSDGKARVRLAVPTGSGDPIEIRVEIASIALVQVVPAE